MKISPLRICDTCKMGIGKFTYQCKAVMEGEFCSSDCYTEALAEYMGWEILKGKFRLVTDGHGGIELV